MVMSIATGGVTGEIPLQHFTSGGFINSAVPGRTDRIPMDVESNSYIIPADVVAGLGQGNSLAGGHIMDMILKTGPYGTSLMSHRGGDNIPRPPPAFKETDTESLAKGGQSKSTPVVVAGAEYKISPVDVMRIGGGSMARGHSRLDAFVRKMRAENIKTLKKLPPPAK